MRKYIIVGLLICFLSYGFSYLYSWRVDAMSGATKSKVNTSNSTNNFFDNGEFKSLPIGNITVSGEIKDTVSSLSLYGRVEHEVVVKELVKKDGEDCFHGAFRYRGISLVDLLSDIEIKKAADRTFKPETDLYVTIENAVGEKVVFSWGELFYSSNQHDIILAYAVAPVYPVKEVPEYVFPEKGKIVVKNDLYSNRNIENPVKISIHSYAGNFPGKKHQKPLYSDGFDIIDKGEANKFVGIISDYKSEDIKLVHFGLHWGNKGVKEFSGIKFKDFLSENVEIPDNVMGRTYFAIGSPDAYRALFSANEILNRSDSKDVLLIDYGKDKDGGRFKIHPQADFFADRTMKSISRIFVVTL